jgi:hypothetical protein
MSRIARLSRARIWLLLVASVALLAVGAWHKRGPMPAEIHSPYSATEAVAPRSAPLQYAIGDGERAGIRMEKQRSIGPLVSPTPELLIVSNSERALQTHRFSLIGTTLSGDLRIALLRENATGESRKVVEGGRVDDLTVAVVGSDRVELRAGSRTEELELRSLGNSPKAEARQEPSSSPRMLPIDDFPARHSDLASAPVTPSTEVDVGALIEDGKSVPNPG